MIIQDYEHDDYDAHRNVDHLPTVEEWQHVLDIVKKHISLLPTEVTIKWTQLGFEARLTYPEGASTTVI